MRKKFFVTVEVTADVDCDCRIVEKLRKVVSRWYGTRVSDSDFVVQSQYAVGMFDEKGKEVRK